MKNGILILALGLAIAAGAFVCAYAMKTGGARPNVAGEGGELLWLKEEFKLSDADFAKVRELHEQYLPACERMCARIAKANDELSEIVLKSSDVTPEVNAKLGEIGKLRQECQAQMLSHFYAVSRTMPEAHGRRYLAEMQKLTSVSAMGKHSAAMESAHDGH